MHAHTTLALSLSATLAYALPASNCSTSTVSTTTTVRAYVLPQHTEVASIAPKQEHIADLRSQISSLKQQLSSQRDASATLCHAAAETTAAPGAHKGNNGGAPGNPSATHEAVNWSYLKTAQMSRLPATSTIAYTDCTSSSGASKPSNYNNKPASSAEATDAAFPYTSYANGTASHYGTSSSSRISGGLSTGVISSSTSTVLSPTYIPKLEDYSIAEIESGEALEDANKVAIQRLQERADLNGSCTFESARVRTEFRKMSNEDRKGFTNAITCLKQTPTSVDASAYPGVKSRYDEYVVRNQRRETQHDV
jgi:hypothetical protein